MLETAFFFDFDGTLVELAATPDGVAVAPRVHSLLSELRSLSNGAVALVSGRGIADLDALLAPLRLPTAGLHGAERRDAQGAVQRLGVDAERIAQMARTLAEVVQANPGMLLENKGAGLALHYRNAPDKEAVARAAAERLVAQQGPAYVLQPGKMVFEIKPNNIDKGRALDAFLGEAPFAGRRPLFAGDDLTDEKGFAVVNERQGISIKIGAGPSIAGARLDGVAALLDWLASIVATARAAPPPTPSC
jgi:trehalose 6-phosphate phosphatase